MAQGDDPATQDDEWALLRQAQQGDEMAFAELVRRHQTAVFNVAYRLLGRRQDAEDAAQEAFLRADRSCIKRFRQVTTYTIPL